MDPRKRTTQDKKATGEGEGYQERRQLREIRAQPSLPHSGIKSTFQKAEEEDGRVELRKWATEEVVILCFFSCHGFERKLVRELIAMMLGTRMRKDSQVWEKVYRLNRKEESYGRSKFYDSDPVVGWKQNRTMQFLTEFVQSSRDIRPMTKFEAEAKVEKMTKLEPDQAQWLQERDPNSFSKLRRWTEDSPERSLNPLRETLEPPKRPRYKNSMARTERQAVAQTQDVVDSSNMDPSTKHCLSGAAIVASHSEQHDRRQDFGRNLQTYSAHNPGYDLKFSRDPFAAYEKKSSFLFPRQMQTETQRRPFQEYMSYIPDDAGDTSSRIAGDSSYHARYQGYPEPQRPAYAPLQKEELGTLHQWGGVTRELMSAIAPTAYVDPFMGWGFEEESVGNADSYYGGHPTQAEEDDPEYFDFFEQSGTTAEQSNKRQHRLRGEQSPVWGRERRDEPSPTRRRRPCAQQVPERTHEWNDEPSSAHHRKRRDDLSPEASRERSGEPNPARKSFLDKQEAQTQALRENEKRKHDEQYRRQREKGPEKEAQRYRSRNEGGRW